MKRERSISSAKAAASSSISTATATRPFPLCDAFTDVQHLAGLQAEGSVRFIEPDDEAYPRIAARKGIAPQRLAAMPVVLHVIALDVAQMSFVWSGFLKAGRSLRQTYLF